MIIKNPNYFEHLKDLYLSITFIFLRFFNINHKLFTDFNLENLFNCSKFMKANFINFQVHFKVFLFRFTKFLFIVTLNFHFYIKINYSLSFIK